MGYQPLPARERFAITHRNLLWGLYVRVLDGDVIWESWLWGAFRRRKRLVPELRPAPPVLSEGDRAAFSAVGGALMRSAALNTPEDVRAARAAAAENRTLTCIDGTVLEFRDGRIWSVVSKAGEVLYERGQYTEAGRERVGAAWPRRTTEPGAGTKRHG